MNLDPRFFHSSVLDSRPQDLADLPTHPIPLDEPARPGPTALRPASTEALREALRAVPRRWTPPRTSARRCCTPG